MKPTIESKLFEPGWAGQLTYDEAARIQDKIFRDIKVRRQWKFKGKGKPALVRIAERAFPENQEFARANMTSELRHNANLRRKTTLSTPKEKKKGVNQ